ncbi:hypothetical protein [Nitrosomonas sp.]|uniref:hypothetical protein n=1 Tax=Nitrosomonas sp. TaxID=42353 RepID=UPI0025DC870E|nr:hypothetical protein [Nitrosomonas sp.]MBY0483461.1 hypothetical protein [Nitrosomonas sp.]
MQLNKALIAISLLLSSMQSFAAGPYDGIWIVDPIGYATINENDGVMIVVVVYHEDYGDIWRAYQGVRTDNKARITNITGEGKLVHDIEIKTDMIAEITQVSCIPPPGYECLLPNGYKLTATKVW